VARRNPTLAVVEGAIKLPRVGRKESKPAGSEGRKQTLAVVVEEAK